MIQAWLLGLGFIDLINCQQLENNRLTFFFLSSQFRHPNGRKTPSNQLPMFLRDLCKDDTKKIKPFSVSHRYKLYSCFLPSASSFEYFVLRTTRNWVQSCI